MHAIPTTLLAAVIAAMAATPALAKDKDKHGGKGGNQHAYVQKHEGRQAKGADRHARAGDDYRVRDGYRSGDRHDRDGRYDRDDYRDHYRDDRHRPYARNSYANCPPGLAKKNNGCLPPGQAKKLAIGQPLPAGAVYTLPRHVRVDLPPPPAGYRYALVHNQVVLVSSHDNLVVEIIRSLLG